MEKSTQNKSLLPVFLIVAVDVLGLTIIIPFLPFYAESFGASAKVVGLLISAYAVCQLVSGPFLGALSDRIGRRPVLLLSQVGTFIGFIMLARAHALWMVFLSRIIDGATAGNISVAQAYIADVTPPKDRAKSFAIIGISFGLGFLIGPAISGLLAPHGPALPIYASAALSMMSILLTYFILPEPTKHVNAREMSKLSFLQWSRFAPFFKNEKTGSYLFQFLCFHLAFALFISGFPLFAQAQLVYHGMPFGPREVAYIYAFAGLLGVILQGGMVGRMVERFGEKKLVRNGFISLAFGYVLLGLSHNVPMVLVSSLFSSFGHASLRPGLTALCSQGVEPHEQGAIMGISQSLNSIAAILMPIIAGLMIDRHWLATWAWSAALCAVVGFALISNKMARSGSGYPVATA